MTNHLAKLVELRTNVSHLRMYLIPYTVAIAPANGSNFSLRPLSIGDKSHFCLDETYLLNNKPLWNRPQCQYSRTLASLHRECNARLRIGKYVLCYPIKTPFGFTIKYDKAQTRPSNLLGLFIPWPGSQVQSSSSRVANVPT